MNHMWDIHCHIIQGVDDGAKTLEEAMDILREESRQGVENLVLTSHFRVGMFETSNEKIEAQFDLLANALAEARASGATWAKDMRIYLGCEFHSNMEMVRTLDAFERPTMAETDYVLVEFSSTDFYFYIKERIAALLAGGYIPIIAHVERYPALAKGNLENLGELVKMGARVQVNADAVIGRQGPLTKHWCRKAISEGLVHAIGSDTHNLKNRPPRMAECAEYLEKKFGPQVAKELMKGNAKMWFE